MSGGIGDLLMHLGFVKALAEHAGAPVTLVLATPPVTTPLLLTQSYVRDVIAVPDLHHDRAHRVARLQAVLAPRRIDTLFLFSYQDHVLRAACVAGIPVRAGFLRVHKAWRAPWMTQRIVVRRTGTPHPDTHTWLPRLFAKYGYPTAPIVPSLTVSPAAAEAAAVLAEDHPKLVGLPDTADAIRAGAGPHLRWLDVTRSALPLTTGHVARCKLPLGASSLPQGRDWLSQIRSAPRSKLRSA